MALKLRGKILFAFLLAALLPVALLGFSTIRISEKAMKNKTTEKLVSDLGLAKAGLETYLRNLKGSVNLQSKQNTATRDAAINFITTGTSGILFKINYNKYSPHINGIMETYQEITKVILIPSVIKNGQPTGKICFVAESPTRYEGKDESEAQSTTARFIEEIGNQFITKEDNHLLARAYHSVVEKNDSVIMDFEAFRPGEIPSMWIASPIEAEKGQNYIIPYEKGEGNEENPKTFDSPIVGVLVVQISPSSINEILQTESKEKSYLAGTNKKGEMVLRSKDTKNKLGQGSKLPEYMNQAIKKGGFDSYKDDKGVKRLVATLPVKLGGLNWQLISEVEESIAFSDISSLKWAMMVIAMIGLAFLVAIALVSISFITKPINQLVARLKDIAEGEGDLTKRILVKSKDEVGELAKWFNLFMEKLQGIIRDLTAKAESLKHSSEELTRLSGQMAEGADNVSNKSNIVAAAAEEMSANVNSAASSMEETSTNIELVASAAEQMTSTINEIARNSEQARNITAEAVSHTQSTTEMVDELGKAAEEIGKVTETITEISEQTNLLALNATIEAARAGEAGKGFAVVANEIKELARQTAEATQEIKEKIEGIQTSTSGTVNEIHQTTKVIDAVNEIVTGIASAVEEQSLTTKEIAANVTSASKGIQEINMNVAQSSQVSQNIARDIAEVNMASSEMSNSSSQVKLSSDDLKTLAEELKHFVDTFVV